MAFHIGNKLFALTDSSTINRYKDIVMSEIAIKIKGENKIPYSWYENNLVIDGILEAGTKEGFFFFFFFFFLILFLFVLI